MVDFTFENIMARSNNMFELATQEEITKLGQSTNSSSAKFDDEIDLEEDVDKTLHIKGNQIIGWRRLSHSRARREIRCEKFSREKLE